MNQTNLLKRYLFIFSSYFIKSNKSKAIFYHDVHKNDKYTNMSTSINLFLKHIEIIVKNNFKVVSNINNETNQIEISFDDGFQGIYDNIERISNIPIQIFFTTSHLNKKNYLSKDQLIDLNLNDKILISSHSNTHVDLTMISKSNVEFELRKSKDILENITNKEVKSLCFPYGRFNNNIIEIAKNIGYNKIYASIPGYYYYPTFKDIINRSLVQFANGNEFKAIINGGDHILKEWYKFKHYSKF